MSDTTHLINTQTDGSETSASGRVKLSRSEPLTGTPSLFGESLLTTALMRELESGSKASTAPCSETKAGIKVPSLSDRLTESLISAGLVKGTIPTLIRKRSDQQILDFVFCELDGAGLNKKPKAG
jgi:hypothetical protein